ncbi:MAG TPA: putative baseplate assembly protein [Longimicrobiaceae bacterium]|nr:putative baseplate assembly protein [Longimicrobiaceae bacterium]
MKPTPLPETLGRVQRRFALSRTPDAVGLDHVRVTQAEGDAWALDLYFVPADRSLPDKASVPAGLTAANLRIYPEAEGSSALPRVERIDSDGDGTRLRALVRVPGRGNGSGTGEPPRFTLELVGVPGVDWLFSSASFALADTPADDVRLHPLPSEEIPVPSGPHISYLAKDYDTFRKLMLDHLSLAAPHWRERNAADVGTMLVELMAYAADYLSYHQDAVATEAYLGTARRRTSLRRHARLLDYTVSEGCNASVLVQLRLEDHSPSLLLPAGSQLTTGGGVDAVCIETGSREQEQIMSRRPQVFETLHPATLYPEHNEIPFYTWGATEYALPAGATRATLREGGRGLKLAPGDLLVFEELAAEGEDTGDLQVYRHAVRLTAVQPRVDPLGGNLPGATEPGPVAVLEIAWGSADALPRPLRVVDAHGLRSRRAARALGNVVLADHGMTVAEELPPVPARGEFRPRLRLGPVTWTVPRDPAAPPRTLAAEWHRDPERLLPVVSVQGTGGEWRVRRDLLASDRFARDFVLEAEEDGSAALRFGDGRLGRRPTAGARLVARYRVGNGRPGNVGREVVGHLVLDPLRYAEFAGRVQRVWNPIAASGGMDAESADSIRLTAPHALRAQERCITGDDYRAVAERYPDVRQATAFLRWTGSWRTARVHVQRRGGRPVSPGFLESVQRFLERFRPIGYDVQVLGPRFVPLDVVLAVRVAPGHVRAMVERALLERFSEAELPGARPGFFHPDGWGFGQSAYLSPVVAAAMEVPGVAAVEARRFTRWRSAGGDEVAEEVRAGPTEIVQCRNDARAPQEGRISFRMEGGA